MKRIVATLVAVLSFVAFGDEAIGHFRQFREMGREKAAHNLPVGIFGVATYVMPDGSGDFVIASADHYDNQGVFVRNLAPDAKVERGDQVFVTGETILENNIPAIRASGLVRHGAMTLLSPPEFKQSDFLRGWRHLRRHRVSGTVESKKIIGDNTLLVIRQKGDAVDVLVHDGIGGLRTRQGAWVEADGIAFNTFDAEGNVTASRLDVAGEADVTLVAVNWAPVWRILAGVALIAIIAGLAVFMAFWLRVRRERRDEALVAADRRRIAEDLHDNMQQLLSGAQFMLHSAYRVADDPEKIVKCLDSTRRSLAYAVAELRSVLWGLQEVSNAPNSIAGLFRYAAERMPHWEGVVEIRSRGMEPVALRKHGGRLLMIMQEAVGNALRHGEARHVKVLLAGDGESFSMTVKDFGRGFDMGAARSQGHMGLDSMRRRAGEAGGSFSIKSTPGKGTTVKVEVRKP